LREGRSASGGRRSPTSRWNIHDVEIWGIKTCWDEDGDENLAPIWGGTDCRDDLAEVHAGALEICNDTLDNDCDGKVDKLDDDCKAGGTGGSGGAGGDGGSAGERGVRIVVGKAVRVRSNDARTSVLVPCCPNVEHGMDPTEYALLARRLIDNPHDAEALAAARRLGLRDPGTYALLLEKVAHGSEDRRTASHWFTEAAAVWATTLGDTRRTEAVLREALRADPWNERAAGRLVQLLEASADPEALLSMLEGRAAACASRSNEVEDGSARAAEMYVQLGHRLGDGPLPRPDRALAAFERAMALDPRNQDAIRSARAMYASARRWSDVSACFEKERALLRKQPEMIQSYLQEAELLKSGGETGGAVRALRFAYALDDGDLEVAESLANVILTRIKSGGAVSRIERAEASELFMSLADTCEGEMALSHVLNALRANPGSDVAVARAFDLASSLGHEAMLAPFAVAYLAENPRGQHSVRVRLALAKIHEHAGRIDDAVRVLTPIESDSEEAAARVLALVQRTGRVEDVVARLDAQAAATPAAARLPILLECARVLDKSGNEDGAVARYEQVLALHPGHPEALDKVASRLRTSGQKAKLRDLLELAAAHASTQPGTRRAQLREAAELSIEAGDPERARNILAQLYEANRNDDAVRDLLKRVLVDMKRWDDVIKILEREIGAARSADKLVAVLREHAAIQEEGRGDLVGAAHSWARIAKLTPEDDAPMRKAVELFERADCLDEAISLQASLIERIAESARPEVFARMAALAESRGKHREAADAAAGRATITGAVQDWAEAERLFALAGAWPEAIHALERQPAGPSPRERAAAQARKADYLAKAGELGPAIDNLEQVCEQDPSESYVDKLQKYCEETANQRRFVTFVLARAGSVDDTETRVSLRRRAVRILRDTLADAAAALDVQRLVLADVDDTDALADLADDAERRGDHRQACDLLLRREGVSSEPADRVRILLRVARLRFEKLDDAQGALDLLERVLIEVDASSVEALEESVRIRTARQDWAGIAMVLERARARASAAEERLALELRLADVCEHRLADPGGAIEYLRSARAIDPANRDTVHRLARLYEATGEWKDLADALQSLLETEQDQDLRIALSIRRAEVLDEKLGQVDDALAALSDAADRGDEQCRETFVSIADRAGRKKVSAQKLERWALRDDGSVVSPALLVGAFERYLDGGEIKDAGRIIAQLGALQAVDVAMAARLEQSALAARDLEVAQVAQGLLIAQYEGVDRAREALRQAEALVAAGAPRPQVLLAAEGELAAIAPSEVLALLPRLADLAASPEDRLALYERQVARSGDKGERIAAIAAAAAEAAKHSLMSRCQRLLAMGVSTATQDDDFVLIEQHLSDADKHLSGTTIRRAWVEALAEGASTARMPGARRADLLRRAGRIAYNDLGDPGQAFDWFNEAMFVRVEGMLDAMLAQQTQHLRELGQNLAAVEKRLEDLERRLGGNRDRRGPPPLPTAVPMSESPRAPSAPELEPEQDDTAGSVTELSAADEVEVTFDGPLPVEIKPD
jgi:tetratricopeptide (TPR) repeat protein